MLIKNSSELLNDKLDKTQYALRKLGLSCLEKALNAVRPKILIEKSVKIQNNILYIVNDKYELKEFDKIYIIGGGKATAEMASGLASILKNLSTLDYYGYINVQEGLEINDSDLLRNVDINYASHPLPNEQGIIGVRSMMELINNATEPFCRFQSRIAKKSTQ